MDVLMYWGRHVAHFEICFWSCDNELNSTGTIVSIWNKVFRIMLKKINTVNIIPRGCYRLWDRQSVESLQWLAYVGRKGTKLLMPVMEGNRICLGYQTWKLTGTVHSRMKSLSTSGVFGMGVPLMEHCWAGMRRQWRCCKNQRCMLQCFLGCEFRKLLYENPGLKNELISHPCLKNSPFNIRDAMYGCRTEARVKQGEEISNVDVISFYPYICKEGKFSCVTRKCTWVQNAPRTVWIWKA